MSGGPMTEAMYYVLLALHRPAHGYQLMQQIARASRGRVQMGPGTLYGVLTRMEKEGLIVLSENDGRRKTYLLTNAGMEALRAEYSRLRAMVRDGAWIGEYLRVTHFLLFKLRPFGTPCFLSDLFLSVFLF